MNIAVSIENAGGQPICVVKSLQRRIDASVADDFKHQMISLAKDGPRHLMVDISDVDFIDSSGLGAIIAALKQLGPEGELTVCGAQEPVLNLFKLTRMDRVFEMCAHPEDILEPHGVSPDRG